MPPRRFSLDWSSLAVGLLLGLLASACPGDPAPRMDVITSTPAQGSVGFALDADPVLGFSAPVAQASLVVGSSVTFFETAAPETLLDLTATADGSVVQFHPAATLKPSTAYTLVLTDGVRGSVLDSGKSGEYPILRGGFTLSFTTSDGSAQQPPMVLSMRPDAGTTDLEPSALDQAVELTFSQDIDLTSLYTHVKVTANGVDTPFDLNLSAPRTLDLRVQLQGEARYGQTIAVHLSTDVRNRNGVAMAAPFDGSFTTRARKWSGAAVQSTARDGVPGPQQVDFDAAGHPWAVWSEQGASRASLQVARYDFATGWSVPVAIDAALTGDSTDPHSCRLITGDTLLVWANKDGATWKIYAATRARTAQAWSAPQALVTSTDAFAQLRLDCSSGAIVTWVASTTATDVLSSLRYRWNGSTLTWDTQPQTVPGTLGRITEFAVTSQEGSSGLLARAVWLTFTTAVPSVHVADYGVGAPADVERVWGTASAVAIPVGTASKVKVADAVVTWIEQVGADQHLQASARTASGTWTSPQTVDATTSGAYELVALPSGPELAVVHQTSSTAAELRVSHYDEVSQLWDHSGAPLTLSEATAMLSPSYAANGDALAWVETDGGTATTGTVRVAPRDLLHPANWLADVHAVPAGQPALDAHPAVAVEALTGDTVVLWAHNATQLEASVFH
jgi:hypothetical protein